MEQKRTLIILAIITVLILGSAIIFNKVQDGKRDWDSMRAGEAGKDEIEAFPFEDEKEEKEGFGAIKTLVLRNKADSAKESYTYELSVENNKLLFSCVAYIDGDKVVLENVSIASSRLVEVTDIIDRYTIATTIRNYRKDPQSVVLASDEDQALEIAWQDGDFANLGYPNGAGDALKRYFEGLANWMSEDKNEE